MRFSGIPRRLFISSLGALIMVLVASVATSSAKPKPTPAALGTAAGKAAGKRIAVPKETVGVLQLTGGESITRLTGAIQGASGELGWSTLVCNGQGTATGAATCGESLMTQGVTLMLSLAVDPPAIGAQLAEAKAKGIPWLAVGLAGGSPLFSGMYGYNEYLLGKTLGREVISFLKGKGTVSVSDTPSVKANHLRALGWNAALNAATGISVVNVFQADLANFAGGALQWASSEMTQYPHLGAFIAYTGQAPSVASVIASRYPGQTPPNAPALFTANPGLALLQFIRDGTVTAAADASIESEGFMAIDQAAEYFARHKKFATAMVPKQYPPDITGIQIITKANVPTDPAKYPTPPFNFRTYFQRKWTTEFSNAS